MKTKTFITAVFIVLFSINVNSTYSQSEQSVYGVYSTHTLNQHFMNEISLNESSYYEWCDAHIDTLQAHWTRYSILLAWNQIEPTLGAGYNWNAAIGFPDSIIINTLEPPNNINCLAVISPGMGTSARSPITYPTEWENFLKAIAERYDGDGISDASPNVHLKYFQLCNEIQDWQNLSFGTPVNYANVANASIAAIRTQIPTAKLLTFGYFSHLQNGDLDNVFKNFMNQMKSHSTDIYAVDIHHWPFQASDSLQSWKMDNVSRMRFYLDSMGYSNSEIWSCEHAAYTGTPTNNFYISEIDQARWLIKSFNYNRLNGCNRFMWSNLLDYYNFEGSQTNPFNSMGLVSDGYGNDETIDRRNTPRIAYWAFKMMVEKTDSPTASLLGNVSYLNNDSTIYAYRWINNQTNQNFYIIWSESGQQQIKLKINTPNAHVTNMITDRFGNILSEYNIQAVNDSITLSIDSDPLLIEEENSTNIFDSENKNGIEIYPNPANRFINIALPENKSKIIILDLLGNIVFEKQLYSNHETLNIDLPDGFYLFQVYIDKREVISKKVNIIK